MASITQYTRNVTGGGKGAGDYILVYDISSNSERRQVDKILRGYGFRIQKSVFECRLNKTLKKQLLEKLKKLELKTGFVKLYKQEYSSKETTIGTNENPNKDEQGYAFIV